ncbi:MAG: D-alanyl-D-alanine carboxypeptidase/D-alanyl-D-alanine-endopeptidase [Planctomycetota bacterium]
MVRFLTVVVVAPSSAPAQQVERLIAAAEALGARTGVMALDADGRVLWRHRAAEVFVPASNQKVLTAAALLSGLGPGYTFTTRFLLEGGRLVVRASGDPNWISGTAHDSGVLFAAVAAALRERGIGSVTGVELRPGTFLGPSRPASWPQDQLQTYYCAPTGPFVLEQGTFQVRLQPGDGEYARAELVAPAAGLPLRGKVTLVARGKRAVYGAQDDGDGVLLRGTFPQRGNPVTIRTAVVEPAAWYEAALGKALRDAGIAIGAAPAAGDQVVYEHASELRLALERMLADSSNFDAEQCLRVLGDRRADGSLAGGLAALRQELAVLVGALPAEVVFADGSGLSKQNRVTPALLVLALLRADAGPGGELLRACLPVAGRNGTLADRFRGTDLVGRVAAKTGWIRGASALSGFVTGRDQRRRAFSILMNYDPKADGKNQELKKLQEEIVAAIDQLEPQR